MQKALGGFHNKNNTRRVVRNSLLFRLAACDILASWKTDRDMELLSSDDVTTAQIHYFGVQRPGWETT